MRQIDEIREFLEREIIPRYDAFDAGHGRDHAHYVIDESLRLASHYPQADRAMLMVAAAYHDLGMEVGRDVHHTESARIVREDVRLRRWFTPDEINEIAQAAEDHRASSDHEPRSLLGRLLAEADRQIDGETIVRRAVQFSLSHYPQLDRDAHRRRVESHIREKYGDDGYLKLWIPESDNAARLAEFRKVIADGNALRELIDRVFAAGATA